MRQDDLVGLNDRGAPEAARQDPSRGPPTARPAPPRRPGDVHRVGLAGRARRAAGRRARHDRRASAPAARSSTASTPASSTARSATAKARSRRSRRSPAGTGSTSRQCYAYSDSASDLPMLAGGRPPGRRQPRRAARTPRPPPRLADRASSASAPRRSIRRTPPGRRRRRSAAARVRRRHRATVADALASCLDRLGGHRVARRSRASWRLRATSGPVESHTSPSSSNSPSWMNAAPEDAAQRAGRGHAADVHRQLERRHPADRQAGVLNTAGGNASAAQQQARGGRSLAGPSANANQPSISATPALAAVDGTRRRTGRGGPAAGRPDRTATPSAATRAAHTRRTAAASGGAPATNVGPARRSDVAERAEHADARRVPSASTQRRRSTVANRLPDLHRRRRRPRTGPAGAGREVVRGHRERRAADVRRPSPAPRAPAGSRRWRCRRCPNRRSTVTGVAPPSPTVASTAVAASNSTCPTSARVHPSDVTNAVRTRRMRTGRLTR